VGFVEHFGAQMSAAETTLLLHLGDVFDPGRDDLRWSSRLMALARELSSHARFAIWLAGNHDVVDRTEVVTSLSPLREAASMSPCGLTVAERPGVYVLGVPDEPDIVVLALPYPSRVDLERWDDLVSEAIASVPSGAGVIVASHLCVDGARLGSESREMNRGQDVFLRAEWLDAVEPVVVVNGHYHDRQVVPCGRHEVQIPGAPIRHTFADSAAARGGLLIEITD